MTWKIPLFKIYSDEDDIKAVTDIIKRGTYWAEGPEIGEFEKQIASYVGQKHAVTFNNGTTALHAIMMAYGIGNADEVIVPSFTFISSANAPLFTGAKPVFADIEESTYGLDPADVRKKITERTKAIIPVHYAGHPCLIDELKEIAEENDLLVLEDAAESLGSKYKGRMTGTFGEASMFSFCQNKIITTGEGGAIVTNDDELAEKLFVLRSHGRASNSNYFTATGAPDYTELGFNFRMPTMCAGLGISQLGKIEKVIDARRQLAEKLNRGLADIDIITTPKELERCRHVYQLYTIRLGSRKDRDGLRSHLEENGIMSKVYFDPIHLTEFYRKGFGYGEGALPVTEDLSGRVLTLPLYIDMGESEIETLIRNIKGYRG